MESLIIVLLIIVIILMLLRSFSYPSVPFHQPHSRDQREAQAAVTEILRRLFVIVTGNDYSTLQVGPHKTLPKPRARKH